MAQVKYQSRTKDATVDGVATSLTYFGTLAELREMQNSCPPGLGSPEGRLKSSRLSQSEGDVWSLEMRFESDADGNTSTPPSSGYGQRSAVLRGMLMSLPLRAHSGYRTKWNHFLAAAPGVTTVPAWWSTAVSEVLSAAVSENYRWLKECSELPTGLSGRWHILCEPTLPETESFEAAVYTVTETIRCRTAAAAGALVANRLNSIGSPENAFGITGGNWKCSDASVSWGGKYWLATLSWSHSYGSGGWNAELYGE